MDSNSIIDRNTFKVYTHAEDCPFAFVCDKRIAPVIACLNQKGYVTLASCGGHYLGGCSEQLNVQLEFLEEYQNDPECFIKEIRDDGFDCYWENRHAYIYVLFEKRFSFDNLPTCFHIDYDEYEGKKRMSIECVVDYFDALNKKKKRNDIEEELDEKCNILMDWVEKLPNIR